MLDGTYVSKSSKFELWPAARSSSTMVSSEGRLSYSGRFASEESRDCRSSSSLRIAEAKEWYSSAKLSKSLLKMKSAIGLT